MTAATTLPCSCRSTPSSQQRSEIGIGGNDDSIFWARGATARPCGPAAGFSAPIAEISHLVHAVPSNQRRTPKKNRVYTGRRSGASLALGQIGGRILKPAVLIVAWTLAFGPTASLLCRTWCDPHAAAASGCHHGAESTDPIMAGADGCAGLMVSGTVFLPEKGHRDRSAADAPPATLVPRYQAGEPAAADRLRRERGRKWYLERPPLSTPLRI
jgi:hypothetical protein